MCVCVGVCVYMCIILIVLYILLFYLAISVFLFVIALIFVFLFFRKPYLPVVYGYNELCNTPISPPSEYYYARLYSSNLMYCGIISHSFPHSR